MARMTMITMTTMMTTATTMRMTSRHSCSLDDQAFGTVLQWENIESEDGFDISLGGRKCNVLEFVQP